ncbi:hypothetical protein MASR1M36_21370 [Candidatus Cloacimonadaceae bacterium]
MAYIDNNTGKAELFRIGEDDKPYIPSLFYISKEGEIFCGDDALFLGKDDPSGLLDQPLKRSLRDPIIRAGNGQNTTPKILLQTLFIKLREKIGLHPYFSGGIENMIVLTIPAQYGPSDELLIRDAAVDAGFNDEHITFLYEPIAAAQAWISENNRQTDLLIVLDCGGGTLDWACLKQPKHGLFELVHDLPPGGDNRIGGYDIDEELYKLILTNLPKDEVVFFRSNRNIILKQIQTVKEKFSKTKQEGILSLSKSRYKVSMTDIEEIVKKRFINQVVSSITPYIEKVNSKYENSKPDLLLVGGSSRFQMLYDEFIKQGNCNPVIWERSEYAPVLGAASYCRDIQNTNSSENVDDNIAKQEQIYLILNILNINKQKQLHAIYHKSSGLIDMGEVEEAYNLLSQVLEVEPDYADAIVLQGKILTIYEEYDKALSLFNRAMEIDENTIDNDEALFALGICYKELNLSEEYRISAFDCFERSSKMGFAPSIRALADCYIEGFGTNEDSTKAFCLYRVAAESGETYSMKVMGECYKNGYFIEQNPQRAFKFYKMAADLDDPEAMELVADCYKNGIGVDANMSEANNWLSKARQASET